MASEKILNQKKEEVSKLAEKMKEAKIILFSRLQRNQCCRCNRTKIRTKKI